MNSSTDEFDLEGMGAIVGLGVQLVAMSVDRPCRGYYRPVNLGQSAPSVNIERNLR